MMKIKELVNLCWYLGHDVAYDFDKDGCYGTCLRCEKSEDGRGIKHEG